MRYINIRTWTVFYRDQFTCMECGEVFNVDLKSFSIFGGLSAHHINGNPSDNRFTNLIALCDSCHLYKAHGGSWKNKPVKHYQVKPVSDALDLEAYLALKKLECEETVWRYINRYATETIETEDLDVI